ncbi:nuclear-pore anchor [Quillaja saponaria]|uniref:Nuclear-pore anchor n=1 Tax=Quillaja saponaria TaxID=32244 RepID=A0AAD7PBR0_QUISA|nr:nuclear-pore anchor [Quillaja saponaria]
MPLFLSDEEFSRCSSNAALVAEKADVFIRGLLNELETVKAKADASDITAEQNCSLVEQKFISLTAEFSKLESQQAQLQSTLDHRLSELAEVQAEKHQLHLKSVAKDGELERLRTEVAELHKSKRQLIELVEQKDLELSEKNTTTKNYLDKIVKLSENAAQKEARLSEIEAELARSQATCARLSQEKELIERHNVWLNDELTAKVDILIELQRKHADLEADMSSKLTDVERRFSECSKSLQWNKDRVRELEMKLASMNEELCSSKEAAVAIEERLSAELSTVNKLNELYKESSEEWSRKAGELEGVIKAMESHLKQVENDYRERLDKEVSVRKQFEKDVIELKEKLEKCEAESETNKKANELDLHPLSNFTTETWLGSFESNDRIEENNLIVPRIPVGVSGTALAASLIRDGWSLAKMYAKYQEAVDALRHEQLGRKESETILQRVLYELEEKAEVILDERAEHERMAEAYSAINQKLQTSLSERANLEKSIQELKADLRRHERDYGIAQKEIGDLQKQVTVLLKECRDIQIRCGSAGLDSLDDTSTIAAKKNIQGDAEKVISEHLLTFKDINGLVEQNAQLRSLVRNLSDQIENRELEFKAKFELELKKHTDEAASKVVAVLQRAEEQQRMIESLHSSVAMYKKLYEEEHNLHSSHRHSSAAHPEEGRINLRLLNETSEEALKKALEQATERVRCLKDELSKSRNEIIILRSERDKLALEAKFAREKLDSFMKEFEHQKAEANGILSRNVEFSQLVVDYQRKLRESSESLRAAEDLSRKLTMELSILKREKEIILNAEKRACDEVCSLSERVHRLQASLDIIQSAEEVREEARVAERRKQEEYIKKVEREWAEAKKELQEERENTRRLKLDREQTLKNAMKQIEEMGKELANALHAVASAESRAAVAEAKLADLERKIKSIDNKGVEMGGEGTSTFSSNEVVAELRLAKEDIEKLKEEAQANKAHMLQYKSIAQVNEDALKQMELAHENFKIEADNLKNSLEVELHSLRRRVSELENESSLKSEEVASAAAGKEEALASSMTEIRNLKEEATAQISQILAMEVQISSMKEDLETEHQKWRTAQSNYERQVILQSETIQELTKTSQALALLQEEASQLRKLADSHRTENCELKAKWEVEKAMLEASKNEAEKKYAEVNEQNKILHSRLEALHIQWAEKDRHSAGLSSGNTTADTFGDAGLQNVISYLRRSKEIAETEVSLLKQEKLRLQSQLESSLKAAESAHATLEAERSNSRSFLFTEEEMKSLHLQVREINLLRESNIQLREENKHNFEECQKLREIGQKARAETEHLENLLRERKNEVDAFKKDIEVQKMAKDQLENRISELLATYKNIDVEDYDRMKEYVREMQDKQKEKDAQIEEISKLLKEKEAQVEEISKVLSQKQDTISHLEQDLANCRLELTERERRINDVLQHEANLKVDVEKHRKMLTQFKKRNETLLKEKEELSKENQALSRHLDEIKQGKRSMGDTSGEQAMKEEKDTKIQILEKHLERHKEELKKEKEDNRTEKARRLKTEKEKTKFVHELEKHKQALRRLSDELEKVKLIKDNLPEGTNMVHILSGPTLDDLATAYISAVENFEKVAYLVFGELGARNAPGDTTSTVDISGAAPGPVIPAQSPSVVPLVASSSLPTRATEEGEKKLAVPKVNFETRKTGRKLVRPRLVKPEDPQGDIEMSEMEGTQNGGRPGPSSDAEAQGNLTLQSQQLVRKRLAPSSTSELQEETKGETGSDVGPPVLKKSKGSDSPQETGEGQPASSLDVPEVQTAGESFNADDVPPGLSEEVVDAEKEDMETIEGKAEESKEPEHFDGSSQVESQNDMTNILEENFDESGGTNVPDAQQVQDEPDNQQSTLEFSNEREEGELVPEVADPEASDISNLMESQEIGESQPVSTNEHSPARVDEDALEAGEINSPEHPSDDKNYEGDVAEEAADASDKSNDGNDPTAVETDQVAEPSSTARESTPTSSAAEISSTRSVSRQETSNITAESEEVRQASPVSGTSRTINLQERARERAQLRQAGVVSALGRGRGRPAPRGRIGRGGRIGRRPPPTDG